MVGGSDGDYFQTCISIPHKKLEIFSLMKSIAIISTQAYSLVNFRGALITDLVASGVRVFALSPDMDSHLKTSLEELGAIPVHINLSRAGLNPVRDLWDSLMLIKILRGIRPDVTLTYLIKPVIFGTVAAYLSGVGRRIAMIEGLGHVFTGTNGDLSWRRKALRFAVSFLYKFSLKLTDQVIFLNRDDIHEFVEAKLVAPSKIIHIDGIGVDLYHWSQVPPCMEPITFILVARLLREKGIIEYIEAAKMIKSKHPAVRFFLLGNTDVNPSSLTKAEVQAWADQCVIEWPGHVDVKPWLHKASVFVLPSYREGLPRSTQEAMAVGRAVITTNVPGCRDTVVDQVNGYLIDVQNVSQLTDAMSKFIADPQKIIVMGVESRKIAESRFDVRRINSQIIRLLHGAGH
jgi:glycosyltransferase involved in cell wall biosynthesis